MRSCPGSSRIPLWQGDAFVPGLATRQVFVHPFKASDLMPKYSTNVLYPDDFVDALDSFGEGGISGPECCHLFLLPLPPFIRSRISRSRARLASLRAMFFARLRAAASSVSLVASSSADQPLRTTKENLRLTG